MPWDIQTETVSFSFLTAGTKEYCDKSLRLEIEKFPLAYWNKSPGNASGNTYNIGWEYSLDGSSWTALDEVATPAAGTTEGIVDLSKVSNKPSGSKFMRCYVYPTSTMGGAESIQTVEILYAGWVEDIENSSGMRSV